MKTQRRLPRLLLFAGLGVAGLGGAARAPLAMCQGPPVPSPADGAGIGSAPKDAEGGEAKPVLFIRDSEFNWGKAFKGEQLDHEFVIENRGTALLEIESLKPNCGCMSVKNEADYKRKLAPGESTKIVLHIDTRILEPGLIKNKHTEIISNAPADENRLVILGEIEELLKLSPPHPTLEVIRSGPPRAEAYRFTLEAAPGRTVGLEKLTSARGNVAVTLRTIEDGKRYEAAVTPSLKDLKTVFQSDDLEASLTVDGRKIPFLVQVAIRLKDRIEVEPSPSVYFRRTETGAIAQPDAPRPARLLEVVSLGGPTHRFKITSAASRDGVFKAEVASVEEGRKYKLTITLLRGPEKGERFLKDTIEVSTDDPEVPLIKIPATAQF